MLAQKLLGFVAREYAFGSANRSDATGAHGASPAETAGQIFAGQESANEPGVESIARAGPAQVLD